MSLSFREYSEISKRTCPSTQTYNEALCNFALGLCGEVVELYQESPANKDSIIKELGDCYWYLSQLSRLFDYYCEDMDLLSGNLEEAESLLFIGAGHIAELVKKIVFHNKTIPDSIFKTYIKMTKDSLDSICLFYEVEVSQVLQANVNKLLERYPNGFERTNNTV